MRAASRPSDTFGTDSSITPLLYEGAVRRYRSIAALHRDLAVCRRCVEAGFPLESLPVVHGAAGRRAYLFGQAPGIVEGAEGRPWRGRAGQTLRRWLQLEEEAFYATFYCASVTRCYPGRTASGRPDAHAASRPLPELAR
jgi:uracil-DNA glycosylase